MPVRGGQVFVGREGSRLVYLGPLIHLPIEVPDLYFAALNSVGELLVEGEPTTAESLARCPNAAPWLQSLPLGVAFQVSWCCEALGLPMGLLEALPACLVAATLTLTAVCDGEPMDLVLSRKAAEAGVRVQALETLEHVVAGLNEIPLDVQVGYLARVAATLSGGPRTWRALRAQALAVWRTGGTWLGQVPPEIARALITRRNQAWLPRVLSCAELGPVMVAVGAAHLHGPHGLPALLRQEGFRFESLGGAAAAWN
jgi:uncharacterized protein